VEKIGKVPSSRAYVSTWVLDNKIYIFGGQDAERMKNDLSYMSLDNDNWYTVDVTGEIPSPRYGASATVVGSKVFLYGGTDGSVILNDLYILADNKWSKCKLEGIDLPKRFGHTAMLLGNIIYIYGGWFNFTKVTETSNELFAINTESLQLNKVDIKGEILPLKIEQSAVVLAKKLYVIGINDGSATLDVYIFDTETSIWTVLPTTGQSIPTKFFGAGVVVDKEFIILGEFQTRKFLFRLNLETFKWEKKFYKHSATKR